MLKNKAVFLGKGSIGSDFILLQREVIIIMTWTVLYKPVDYLSAHVNAELKEHEIDISGTEQDIDFKIAEDVPAQSFALSGKSLKTCTWFA